MMLPKVTPFIIVAMSLEVLAILAMIINTVFGYSTDSFLLLACTSLFARNIVNDWRIRSILNKV